MDVYVLDLGQDDPSKCTAKKMVHMGLAVNVHRKFHAGDHTIVLNPFADRLLVPSDGAKGILVVDCSWKIAREVFFRKVGGKHRRLPALLAGNPTNYARLWTLSSVEAVAATMYITGDPELASRYLSIYKWGPTFETLNKEPLEEYSRAETQEDIMTLEREFFPQIAHMEEDLTRAAD